MKISQRSLGIIEIVIAGFCFGFLGLFGKWAYSRDLTSGQLLSLRFCLASLILWPTVIFFYGRKVLLPIKQLLLCLSLGILGYAVFSTCYFHALEGLSASLVSLLLYTYPIFVTLGAFFIFREPVHLKQWLALPIVMIGLIGLVWGDFSISNISSFAAGIGSAFFYSIYILVSSHYVKNVPALVSTVYIQTATAVSLSLIHLTGRSDVVTLIANSWEILLGISIIASIIPMVLIMNGLKRLSSSEASVLSTIEPITAVVASYFILGEKLLPIQLLGGSLVLAGLILTSLKKDKTQWPSP